MNERRRGEVASPCILKDMNKTTQDSAQPETKAEIAQEFKAAFDLVSPFIEKHTSIVCPDCEKVCCIDKHGRYDENDLAFLNALGAKTHHDLPDREETDPCRFLNEKGCSLARWERPFRCTQFFCNPLLKSLENDNAKLYRTFVEYLQYLISVRQRLLDEAGE
ncbi:MAG: hypothetical protein HZC49_14845 [Nitrospirae bacterium]|nr:hypothetical protein [Nitrospirota bacterium]